MKDCWKTVLSVQCVKFDFLKMPPKKAASNGPKAGKGSSGEDDKSKDKKAGTGSSVKVSWKAYKYTGMSSRVP